MVQDQNLGTNEPRIWNHVWYSECFIFGANFEGWLYPNGASASLTIHAGLLLRVHSVGLRDLYLVAKIVISI